jgi:alpha-amylase
MTEWALPPRAQRERHALEESLRESGLLEPGRVFLRGGHWDGFLSRYPEVNYFHKRMLEVSRRLAEAEEEGVSGLEEARRALYRAQVNCPYWHGLFGGLYLNGIRQEVFRNLILAERLLAESGRRPPLVERRDLDLEGDEEILVRGTATGAVLKPTLGGGLVELDVLEFPFNLLDVVARREEAYHDELERAAAVVETSEEEGPASIHDLAGDVPADLNDRLTLDAYRRLSALDRLVEPGLRAAGSRRGAEEGERGGDPNAPYRVEEVVEQGRKVRVRLSARRRCDGRAVLVEKTLRLDPDAGRYRVELRLECEGEGPLPALYAQEWNLTLLAPDARDRRILVNGRAARPARMNAEADHREVVELALEDGWSGIRAAFCPDRPVRLQRYPVETVSRSERGFEATYQGTCLLLVWPDPPSGGSVFEAALDLTLGRP